MEEKTSCGLFTVELLEPLHSTKSVRCDVNIDWIASLLILPQPISKANLQTVLIKDTLVL